jgi:hypothetical protein
MRRDQMRREVPLISGNLPPADLPNPHEPIRSEETANGHLSDWMRYPYSFLPDDDRRLTTVPLSGEATTSPNGHAMSTSLEDTQDALPPSPLQQSLPAPAVRQNWLARLLRLSLQK